MKIELKSIIFSEALSEETNAFTANLYINGKKVGYCKNQGHGGCTYYNSDSSNDRKTIAYAEDYCKALPKTKWKDKEFNQSLEGVIDDLLEDWLKAKETKKFERKMLKAILVGSPDENRGSYSVYGFKVALSTIPVQPLQEAVNRIKMKLKAGDVILNTNLEALGVNV